MGIVMTILQVVIHLVFSITRWVLSVSCYMVKWRDMSKQESKQLVLFLYHLKSIFNLKGKETKSQHGAGKWALSSTTSQELLATEGDLRGGGGVFLDVSCWKIDIVPMESLKIHEY